MLTGWATPLPPGGGLPYSIDLAAEIAPDDPLFAVGWRQLFRVTGAPWGVMSASGLGIGEYVFTFGVFPPPTVPNFPFGVSVTQSLFPT